MKKNAKIYIAGHQGLVGSAILRNLQKKGFNNFVFTPHSQYDLRNQTVVENFFEKEKPDYVIVAAAKVGGIVANNRYRAEFIYDNIMIQANIINSAYKNNVKKMLILGSSCIYPKFAPQPMQEKHLLTGELEYTNEPYAIAKIAGLKMAESYNLQYGTNFLPVMPTNLYGPNDNFDLEKSHVLPALIRKMHLAKSLMNNDWQNIRKDFDKNPVEGTNGQASENEIMQKLKKYGIIKNGNTTEVTLWGTGQPKREFLHSDDLADACVFLMENIDFKDILTKKYGLKEIKYPIDYAKVRNTHINLGVGEDLSIKELAEIVKEITNFEGKIIWDSTKPDGTPRKLLDVSKLNNYGWKAKIPLKEGIKAVYKQYQL